MYVAYPVEGLQLAHVLASGSFIELLIILVRAEPGAISWTLFWCTSAVILCCFGGRSPVKAWNGRTDCCSHCADRVSYTCCAASYVVSPRGVWSPRAASTRLLEDAADVKNAKAAEVMAEVNPTPSVGSLQFGPLLASCWSSRNNSWSSIPPHNGTQAVLKKFVEQLCPEFCALHRSRS